MSLYPNSRHQNSEEAPFCVNGGADRLNGPKPDAISAVGNYPDYTVSYFYGASQSILENDLTKFVLYVACIFVPIIGLILALIVSVTPFEGQKELSIKLIRCACIAWIVWLAVGAFCLFIGLMGGFFITFRAC